MMCDYQMFWHEHRKRPRLITSMTLGKGYTEYMADDGKIKRRHYDMYKVMREMFQQIRIVSELSPLAKMLKR